MRDKERFPAEVELIDLETLEVRYNNLPQQALPKQTRHDTGPTLTNIVKLEIRNVFNFNQS